MRNKRQPKKDVTTMTTNEMACQFGVWDPPIPEDGPISSISNDGRYGPAPRRRASACGALGKAYRITAESGDTFKFGSQGVRASAESPLEAVLCSEHATKLVRQGCVVVEVI